MKLNLILLCIVTSFIGCAPIKTNKKFEVVKIYEQHDLNQLGPCEPGIAINKTNPDNIVASSVLNNIHVSNNGGKTWNTFQPKCDLGIYGDPVIECDNQGNFYYFHLSDIDGKNWKSEHFLDRIVMQKSTDQGNSWTLGNSIGHHPGKQQDKQWACINPENKEIYVTWTEFDNYGSNDPNCKSRILFSKSTDEGLSWSQPIQISTHEGDCQDDDLTTEGAVPTSDGKNIYVSWSWNHKIYFTKSEDLGRSWSSEETIIATQKSGWSYQIPEINRANGFPITESYKSKNKGILYVNWSDQINKNETNIYLSKSLDKGKTWSPAKIVNPKIKGHYFFNWMSIDPTTGYIHIIYYMQNAYSKSIDVIYSYSKNQGEKFKHIKLNKKPFSAKGVNFFGDYNNIDSYNKRISPIWTQAVNGKLEIWNTVISE